MREIDEQLLEKLDGYNPVTTIALEWSTQGVAMLVMQDLSGRNTLSEEMRRELADALRLLYADDDARAIVLASANRNFCTGGDLSLISGVASAQAAQNVMAGVNELPQLLDASPKPLVAAVAGHCVGAGAGVALLCDLIVADSTAKFSFPFINIGLVADCGVSYTLPRRIGVHAARRALIEGRTFDAATALDVGLIDELCDEGSAAQRAIERATKLAEAPAHALMQMRTMTKNTPLSFAAALEQEALHQAICFGSDDVREGVKALSEKRKPNFMRQR